MPCRIFTRRKRREFDGFLEFFAGSENPSVLAYTDFRVPQNAEKAQIIAFYTRDMYSPVRVSTLIVSPWFTKKGTWMI